jgi:hypothetical protein
MEHIQALHGRYADLLHRGADRVDKRELITALRYALEQHKYHLEWVRDAGRASIRRRVQYEGLSKQELIAALEKADDGAFFVLEGWPDEASYVALLSYRAAFENLADAEQLYDDEPGPDSPGG